MKLNGTTHSIMRRRLTRGQYNELERIPQHLRLGAMWRMLKFGHPWPRHKNRT